ncbi:uncharacterized protein G2W53_035211 [Senna tora]|uniref:Uncharacterized protein n=1 Tax=Senna tora TaxID=362788 RepID=A0A834SSF6_9FABA|nr:uncharacterized protein G2W53_035211 [Senna tora]
MVVHRGERCFSLRRAEEILSPLASPSFTMANP